MKAETKHVKDNQEPGKHLGGMIVIVQRCKEEVIDGLFWGCPALAPWVSARDLDLIDRD